ncbi:MULTISPECIES: GH39 family glycosyl hydrolase [Acetobacter]|uniref:GH39 family glycosyl hydrolase n=1 Tax=Acetobacter TaxID=434 RepID=UPI00376F7A71
MGEYIFGRRKFTLSSMLYSILYPTFSIASDADRVLDIDLSGPTEYFIHYWKECIGSDRAIVALRLDWLQHLQFVKKYCGFKSVRFHGLLNDEMGLCRETCNGSDYLNFLYIDEVFDNIIKIGMKPFVELSFMPLPLRSSDTDILWYRANTSPPRKMNEWFDLIKNLTEHLALRYGVKEVASWNFEVWNEPNINFWSGSKEQYFNLYKNTREAIKEISNIFCVGGPATAQMGWISDFINFCVTENCQPDFISSHIYEADPQDKVFHNNIHLPNDEVIPTAVSYIRDEIDHSALPDLPLFITEWSSNNPAYILTVIYKCIGKAKILSYWIFDSTFEENGPVKGFGDSYFGLLDQGGIPKPSFHAFHFLNKLSHNRIIINNECILSTYTKNGIISLVWNYSRTNDNKNIVLKFDKKYKYFKVTVYNPKKDKVLALWEEMKKPVSPTQEEYEKLRNVSMNYEIKKGSSINGTICVNMDADSIHLVEISEYNIY